MALLSPILVGRDDLLALAERRLNAVSAGTGHVLFLAGEAGIGKTRLLGSIVRRAERLGFSTVSAAAFSRDIELPGGLLLDLAANLRAGSRREVGEQLTARLLDTPAPSEIAEGDRHRRRRLVVLAITDLLAGLADPGPVLLALEDLHWADDLSLEVVGQLARRLPTRPMLVVGTYRSDELYPRLPMREWRNRLLSQRLAEEAPLARLSRQQTATMIQATLGLPAAPEAVLADVYARSDGIPLHVEEFLALSLAGGTAALPQALGDAVAARAEQLSHAAREVARCAAVIGRSFHFDLLADIVDDPPEHLAESLRELAERSFVQPGAEPATFDFRHALIRDALYDQLGLPRRRELHARVAQAGRRRGMPDAVLSVHCEAADLHEEAYKLALRAATEAGRTSSHREALELLRRAQRCEPASTSPLARAELLAALATEAAATDDNTTADDAYERSYKIFLAAGESLRAAALVAPWTAVRHLLGEELTERVTRLRAGLALLPGSSTVESERVRVSLLAELSAAYMLDRRLDESIEYGQQALAGAQAAGATEAQIHVAATLGSVLVFAGRYDEGWPMLESAVTQARDQQHEAEAARAYRMIGSSASVLVEYDRAEQWLRDGIAYAERVELGNHQHYMVAHLAHVAWATGDWSRAQALGHAALDQGQGGITTRITALHVLGYLALGQGDWASAEAYLSDARDLGERMAELQRLSPALWGLAELALLRSDPEGCLAFCERGLQASAAVSDAAYLFPFLVTGTRALLSVGEQTRAADWVHRASSPLRSRRIPGTMPALDHALGLVELAAGRSGAASSLLGRAVQGWADRRRFWEGAFATLDLARSLKRTRRAGQALELVAQVRERAAHVGAVPLLAAADAMAVPSRRLPAWHPLTAREFEVAGLIADGLTNREIAARLLLAPKTVSAHVEHILAKLGASRRAEIASWVGAARARQDG